MEQYEEVRTLGRGAFGTATLTRSKTGGRRAPLRVVKQVDLASLTQAQRETAHKEVGVLRQLSHPHIVGFFHTFLDGTSLYIVMEYADGGELASKIKERQEAEDPYRDDEAMKIFGQCVQALRFVHSKRIIHRDIKSQNIFLTTSGDVKLGDFGIAKVMEGTGPVAGTIIGTPSYFPPELCEDKPYGSKVDIWSMGVVLYELVALILPFQASSVAALVMKILAAEPAPLPDRVSKAVSDVVTSTLQKVPEDRPSAEDLLKLPIVSAHVSPESERNVASMDQFEELTQLGRGAFGVALLVKPRNAGSAAPLRVIKTIDLTRMEPKARKGAEAEVALLRRLHHPHIIAYYDAFVENETLHMVLEYADAGDLSTALRQRKEADDLYSENDALKMVAQCLLALHYIHGKSIIHRDIKGQNVFLMKTGDAKLGDFGISKVMDATVSAPTATLGAPAYMSPEMCKGDKYDSKVDIWSIGVVLYELLSFKQPFQAAHIPATVMKIVNDDPPPLPSRCSSEICEMVRQMLQKKAEDRPTAEELLMRPEVAASAGSVASLLAAKSGSKFSLDGAQTADIGTTWDDEAAQTGFSGTSSFTLTSPVGKSAADVLAENCLTCDPCDSIDGLPKKPPPEVDLGTTMSTIVPDLTVIVDSTQQDRVTVTQQVTQVVAEPHQIGSLGLEVRPAAETADEPTEMTLGSTLKDPELSSIIQQSAESPAAPESPAKRQVESQEEERRRLAREAREAKRQKELELFAEEEREWREAMAGNDDIPILGVSPRPDEKSSRANTGRLDSSGRRDLSQAVGSAPGKSPRSTAEFQWPHDEEEPPIEPLEENPEALKKRQEQEKFEELNRQSEAAMALVYADLQSQRQEQEKFEELNRQSEAAMASVYADLQSLHSSHDTPSRISAERLRKKEKRAEEEKRKRDLRQSSAQQYAHDEEVFKISKQREQGTACVFRSEQLHQQKDALDHEIGRRPYSGRPHSRPHTRDRNSPLTAAEYGMHPAGHSSRPISGAGSNIVASHRMSTSNLSRPSTEDEAHGSGTPSASSSRGHGMNDPVRIRGDPSWGSRR